MSKLRKDVSIGNTYTIDNFAAEDVFLAGSNSDLWPRFDNINLQYLDQDPYIKQYGRISLDMTIDALPKQLAKFRNIRVDGHVEKCDPSGEIIIVGQTPGVAAVEIGLYFSDNYDDIDDPLVTTINYETTIELRNFLVRKLGKSILRDTLKTYVPRFCEEYRDNVINELNREQIA